MNPAARHTLVIPTFNRPELLKKIIQYYRDRASWIDVLVLDSSRTEIASQNAAALSRFGAGVSHVVFAQDVAVVSKLCDGLALVRTPTVSFCADDDLVFPQGLSEAIAFLQDHHDFVCAHGLYLNFRPAGRDLFLASEYSSPSIDAAHSGARVFQLCQRYESLFYAVFRTPGAQDVFAALTANSTLHFQELFQSVAAVIQGKAKRLPVIYGARRSGPPAETARDKWQTYTWFADNPAEVLEHYRIYCDLLETYYQAHVAEPRSPRQEFVRMLDLAHAVYFAAGCPADYFFSKLQPLWPEDSYRRAGRLDALLEAGRLAAMKRALLPDRQQELDVLEQFRLSSTTRDWSNSGLLGGVRFLYESALGCLRLMHLNAAGNQSRNGGWRCRLPKPLLWLAASPLFRSAYFELHHYLGKPDSSAR